MRSGNKARAVFALVFLTFCLSPMAAQISDFVSNTSEATGGLFTAEIDNFLDVNAWQELEFDKFFTTMQVQGTGGIGAGLAKNAGSVYLGFGYFGRLWSGGINSETREYGDSYANAAWRGKKTVNRNYLSDSGLSWASQISFLLGTNAAGGIRADVNFAGAGNDNDDADTLGSGGDITTAKSSLGLGTIEAGLGWGRNFDLGNGYVLKPNAGFSYNADLRKTVSSPGTAGGAETTMLTGIDPFFTASGYTGVNSGRVGLKGYLTAHAGLSVDLAKNTGDGSLWLGYDLKYNFYDRQTNVSSGAWTDYSPSLMGHYINAGLGAWYTLDRKVSLGWSVESCFELINASVTSAFTSAMASGGLSPDHEYSETLFTMVPKAVIGVVYKMLPDKFNFNASIGLYPIGDGFILRKLDHTDISGVAAVSAGKKITVNSAYAATSLGFTWFITDGFSFDAAATTLASGSKVNLTQFSALLSYKM